MAFPVPLPSRGRPFNPYLTVSSSHQLLLQDTLKQALLTGLSYSMTGENNGQPSAYAFSELELACLPPGWRPPWQLCGKVMS